MTLDKYAIEGRHGAVARKIATSTADWIDDGPQAHLDRGVLLSALEEAEQLLEEAYNELGFLCGRMENQRWRLMLNGPAQDLESAKRMYRRLEAALTGSGRVGQEQGG